MSGKIKLFAGIALILFSAVFMYFWETTGRDLVMNEEVIVTTVNLEAGTVLSDDKIRVAAVPEDAIMEDCIRPENLKDYIGKTIKHSINANSQIAVNSFISGENPVTEDMSIFTIKSEWIKNLSSSIRCGDIVTIYGYMTGNSIVNLGSYYVAFSKDSSGREVVEASGNAQPDILRRSDGLYVPSYIEVAAKISDYSKLLSYLEGGWSLLIVQDEVGKYEQ